MLVVLPSQDARVGLPMAVTPSMASALRHVSIVFRLFFSNGQAK